jgi:hypothetical protein
MTDGNTDQNRDCDEGLIGAGISAAGASIEGAGEDDLAVPPAVEPADASASFGVNSSCIGRLGEILVREVLADQGDNDNGGSMSLFWRTPFNHTAERLYYRN